MDWTSASVNTSAHWKIARKLQQRNVSKKLCRKWLIWNFLVRLQGKKLSRGEQLQWLCFLEPWTLLFLSFVFLSCLSMRYVFFQISVLCNSFPTNITNISLLWILRLFRPPSWKFFSTITSAKWFISCLYSVSLQISLTYKAFPQLPNGLTPVCTLVCLFRICWLVKLSPQTSQPNGLSPLWTHMCLWVLSKLNLVPQTSWPIGFLPTFALVLQISLQTVWSLFISIQLFRSSTVLSISFFFHLHCWAAGWRLCLSVFFHLSLMKLWGLRYLIISTLHSSRWWPGDVSLLQPIQFLSRVLHVPLWCAGTLCPPGLSWDSTQNKPLL